MDKEISKMLLVCVALEGVITYINNFFVTCEPHYQMVLSLLLGIIISVSYEVDFFKLAKMESKVPYLGCILTGILFSRGSNYIYDILQTFNCVNFKL